MNLIFLTGQSGSGKSTVAEKLSKHGKVVSTDAITRRICQAYFPQARNPHSWKLVNRVLPDHKDQFFPPASTISSYLAERLEDEEKPLVLEGVMLSNAYWHEEIFNALKMLGHELVEPNGAFFLNPNAETVAERHEKRRKLKRPNGEVLTVEIAAKRRADLEKRLPETGIEWQEFEKSEEIQNAIQSLMMTGL